MFNKYDTDWNIKYSTMFKNYYIVRIYMGEAVYLYNNKKIGSMYGLNSKFGYASRQSAELSLRNIKEPDHIKKERLKLAKNMNESINFLYRRILPIEDYERI